jgi:hypothetical protein
MTKVPQRQQEQLDDVVEVSGYIIARDPLSSKHSRFRPSHKCVRTRSSFDSRNGRSMKSQVTGCRFTGGGSPTTLGNRNRREYLKEDCRTWDTKCDLVFGQIESQNIIAERFLDGYLGAD